VHYCWQERLCGVVPAYFLLVLLLLAVQIQVCFWALSGFYDGLALLFLVLLVGCYKRRLWAHALFFFAVAVFFHFRSLWFFPLAGLAAFHLVRDGFAQVLASRQQILLLLSSGLILAVSGFFFLLAYPAMVRFPLVNPWFYKTLKWEDVSWLSLLLFGALAGVLLVRRDWLLLGSVAGVLLVRFNTRQMQHWHSLSLTPLVLCSRQNSPAGLVTGSMAYGIISYLFLQVWPFDPVWGCLYYLGS
jgi:hypothetical protein